MCLSPISIPNLNRGCHLKDPRLSSVIDVESAYISVPCHHCSECIHNDQLALVQRLQMESLCNYLFFATLTYNNEMIPQLVTSSGFNIKYADWRDLQLVFKRINNKQLFTRPFRYLAVSERGKKKGRPHFHVIFLIPRYENDDEYTPINLEKHMYKVLLEQWKRKVGGSSRKPIYKPLCTFQKKFYRGKLYYNYDLHYVVPSLDDSCADVAFYVTKYLLKRSDKDTKLQQALRLNLPPDEYESTWKLCKSRIDSSLFLGLSPLPSGLVDPRIQEYISKCVARSDGFPQFFDYHGNSFPLAHYYKSIPYLFSLQDAIRLNQPPQDDKSFDFIRLSIRKYEKQIKEVSDRGDFEDFGNIFD